MPRLALTIVWGRYPTLRLVLRARGVWPTASSGVHLVVNPATPALRGCRQSARLTGASLADGTQGSGAKWASLAAPAPPSVSIPAPAGVAISAAPRAIVAAVGVRGVVAGRVIAAVVGGIVRVVVGAIGVRGGTTTPAIA